MSEQTPEKRAAEFFDSAVLPDWTTPEGVPAKLGGGLQDVAIEEGDLQELVRADSWEARAYHGHWVLVKKSASEQTKAIKLGVAATAVSKEEVVNFVRGELDTQRALMGLEGATAIDTDGRKPAAVQTASTRPTPEEFPSPRTEPEGVTAEASLPSSGRRQIFDLVKMKDKAKSEGRPHSVRAILEQVHKKLKARVVTDPAFVVPAGHSLLAGRLLIPDARVKYLRVVGIGAADSSGNRGRYGRITKVTGKRVDVDFEDKRAGKYLVKEKAEPVDEAGYSLVDGKPPFTKAQLEEAERLRKQARSKNKQKPTTPENPTFGDSDEEEDDVLPAPNTPVGEKAPTPQLKAASSAQHGLFDTDSDSDVEVVHPAKKPRIEQGAGELVPKSSREKAMASFAQGLRYLTEAGMISARELQIFRKTLGPE